MDNCILCGNPFTPGEDGNELGFCTSCQESDDFPYDLDAYYKAYDNGDIAFKGFDTMSRGLLESFRKPHMGMQYNKVTMIASDMIDYLEDLLYRYGIDLPNPDKKDAGDHAANVYGEDYYHIEDNIVNTLVEDFNVNIIDPVWEEMQTDLEPITTIHKSKAINFAGYVIDMFEGTLSDYNVNLPNPEKKEAANPANIFGEDYFKIEDGILEILQNKLGLTIESD